MVTWAKRSGPNPTMTENLENRSGCYEFGRNQVGSNPLDEPHISEGVPSGAQKGDFLFLWGGACIKMSPPRSSGNRPRISYSEYAASRGHSNPLGFTQNLWNMIMVYMIYIYISLHHAVARAKRLGPSPLWSDQPSPVCKIISQLLHGGRLTGCLNI